MYPAAFLRSATWARTNTPDMRMTATTSTTRNRVLTRLAIGASVRLCHSLLPDYLWATSIALARVRPLRRAGAAPAGGYFAAGAGAGTTGCAAAGGAAA